MFITTFKSLLENDSLNVIINKLLRGYESQQITYLTTQFPAIYDPYIKFVYMDLPYMFPTYLCNLSDCYPNLDALIIRTEKINVVDLIHKYRITIFLCDDISDNKCTLHERSLVFDNDRQITVLHKEDKDIN